MPDSLISVTLIIIKIEYYLPILPPLLWLPGVLQPPHQTVLLWRIHLEEKAEKEGDRRLYDTKLDKGYRGCLVHDLLPLRRAIGISNTLEDSPTVGSNSGLDSWQG